MYDISLVRSTVYTDPIARMRQLIAQDSIVTNEELVFALDHRVDLCKVLNLVDDASVVFVNCKFTFIIKNPNDYGMTVDGLYIRLAYSRIHTISKEEIDFGHPENTIWVGQAVNDNTE